MPAPLDVNFLTCPGVPELPPPKSEKEPVLKKESKEPQKENKEPRTYAPPKKRGWIKLVVFLLILGFGAVTIPPGISLGRAYFAGQEVKASLGRAEEDFRRVDLPAAVTELAYAREVAIGMREDLRGIGFWRDMPWIGAQLRGLEEAAAAGIGALDGVEELVSAFSAVTEAMNIGSEAVNAFGEPVSGSRSFQDLSREEKYAMLAKLNDALPKMRLARTKIDLALQMWERVPQDDLAAPVRQALKPLAENLPLLKKSLDEAVPLLEVGIPLAGYPDRMRYLVLLQNADEIRATGGFIGNVGIMTMEAGELVDFNFIDVYNVDNPASGNWKEVPPQPFVDHLGAKAWFMRDANWSPDFPTSAEKVLDFYLRERAVAGNPEKDPPTAVLAFEPEFFNGLLRLTGPVTVDGKTFDANNFFDKIQYEVEQGFLKEGIPLEQRKALVSAIGSTLMQRVRSLPSSQWPKFLDLMTTSLERKQVLLYARNPSLLAKLDQRNWTARMKPTQGDFVQIVDSNLAALKTDGVMAKTAKYEIDARDPQNPIATVTLKYTNTNRSITWRYTRYRSYTRVYVPEGSQLLESSGAMADDRHMTGGKAVPGRVDVYKDLGKTVFGAFWAVEPGQTGTLRFKYRLPPSAVSLTADGEYRLDWPKQPGVDAMELTLGLSFGKNVSGAVPPEAREKWGDARYEVEADTLMDRTFLVDLK